MRFTKMHGLGNDYIYVNCFEEKVCDPAQTAIRVSDRHFGVGSDGLILVLPSSTADVCMRMFNADGSESQMCGNGVRCVAKFAYDRGLVKASPLADGPIARLLSSVPADETGQITVETGRGVLTLGLAIRSGRVEQVCVNMGTPILPAAEIPTACSGEQVVNQPFEVEGFTGTMTCVSMGNPHAAFYVDDVAAVPLEQVGPRVENHKLFPERINAHFVQVVTDAEVIMRTWERGSGITLACGTGASAVCVAGVLTGKSAREILAHLPGGDLRLRWDDVDNHVYMLGPATEVFTGVIESI